MATGDRPARMIAYTVSVARRTAGKVARTAMKFTGRPASFSVASVMMPSVPSDPVKRAARL